MSSVIPAAFAVSPDDQAARNAFAVDRTCAAVSGPVGTFPDAELTDVPSEVSCVYS
ncbi:hypothetical protein POF43_026070 [Streptomyces sp. SL54]|uniref:Uncharacterized protein n=1 Tax=Streptantibioticus silvisoli TaxID=2705255 RepID=A0ABT6W9K4_9ACTN|nr:hypothetical protein [Streptantibioticus silvisoli]